MYTHIHIHNYIYIYVCVLCMYVCFQRLASVFAIPPVQESAASEASELEAALRAEVEAPRVDSPND